MQRAPSVVVAVHWVLRQPLMSSDLSTQQSGPWGSVRSFPWRILCGNSQPGWPFGTPRRRSLPWGDQAWADWSRHTGQSGPGSGRPANHDPPNFQALPCPATPMAPRASHLHRAMCCGWVPRSTGWSESCLPRSIRSSWVQHGSSGRSSRRPHSRTATVSWPARRLLRGSVQASALNPWCWICMHRWTPMSTGSVSTSSPPMARLPSGRRMSGAR